MSVSSPPPPSPSSPPPRLPSPCPVAILCVQCGMSDLNCDPVSSVWRAGLQPRSCECSVAYRTPTAILRVQCGVPDPNCDLVCSVLCAGPQLRFCEFSVAYRTPTAILRVQCGVPDPNCDLTPDISLCIWIQPLVGGAICWNKRCFELFGGLLTCLMPCVYPTDMFDREYPDMFWHV